MPKQEDFPELSLLISKDNCGTENKKLLIENFVTWSRSAERIELEGEAQALDCKWRGRNQKETKSMKIGKGDRLESVAQNQKAVTGVRNRF